MSRLAVLTCLFLGTALAKPPPSAKSKDPLDSQLFSGGPVPYGASIQPYQNEPEPIQIQEGVERDTQTLPSGQSYIKSPNYPSNYPNNYDSSFTLKGDNNQDITITCSPFRMESHSTCAYDFLSINGRKYCGTNAPPTITASVLNIRIKTDYSVTATGFSCLVTVTSGSGVTTTAPSGDCRCGQRQTRVVGGTDATAGQFPWQAGLVSPGGTRTFCGGSVINNRYVLTAAHCTEGSSASEIQVMLGDLRIGVSDAGEQRYSVQQIIEHPQYTSASGSGWDFSLLKLDREITFSSTISPVCLPTAGQMYADATAIASGYGRVGATQPQATTLQHVQVPVWSQSRCTSTWGSSTIKINMICAGGYPEGGRSVCMGDSGGPLVTDDSGSFRLIGVVSFGKPCAVANWPDVFARVTEALPWITSNTADATYCTP